MCDWNSWRWYVDLGPQAPRLANDVRWTVHTGPADQEALPPMTNDTLIVVPGSLEVLIN